MFSSGCASCCYKQGQGWTQGEEATVMSIENMEIYNCKGEVQLSCIHVVLSKEMSMFRSTMIPPHSLTGSIQYVSTQADVDTAKNISSFSALQ